MKRRKRPSTQDPRPAHTSSQACEALLRRLPRAQAERLAHFLQTPHPCQLCGTYPAEHNGMFIPDHPEQWGGAPGRPRLVLHALCHRCHALPDCLERVEARLKAVLTAGLN